MEIGKYKIATKKVYNALNEAGATSNGVLKKFDKNSDMKITEDELVEFLDDESQDTKENEKTNSSTSSKSGNTSSAMSQIEMYDEALLNLEVQLTRLSSYLATAKDIDSFSSIMANINQIQNEINQKENAIYNLLVQAENQAIAASGVPQINGQSTERLTTGNGIQGTTGFGSAIVNIAQSYVGKLKESDGSYLKVTGGRHEAWCADFATYVVKEAAKQTGTSINGFGSPSVSSLKAWGEANKCYGDITGKSAQSKADYIAKNVQPGDVMIMKSNGASHTGIVSKVYPDGSFDTVEGNTSDQCLNRHYKATEARLSGFIDIT